uniref:cysteine dioxygenase n=2 Tax=Oryza sativa subsp. japonica TaxID=39947 RepID=Q53QB8_ORYSJ|nr:hypothetical protein LOC_Os11g47250 [Oryza sativa Japonica Group]ABA95468.1 hypothetical protein LOC_Os11g47250 [Oryza sativa Japonica Group]
MGVHVFTDRLAFAAADWCFRLHGWSIMPPLLGVYDFTTGLPPSPPTGVLAYTVGRLRLHRQLASVAAEWCLRLHGWPIMPLLLGVYDFTAGMPPSPPSGASAYTAGLLCRCCWASTTSPPACLRRRRVVPPPTRLAYYAAAVGRLRLHRRPASVAADWCLRLHGWPIWLVGHTTVVGRLRLHHRPASVAADWCLRLHGWPIMPLLLGVYDFAADWCLRLYGWLVTPPLLGVYVFTTGLPPSPPTGASAYTAGLLFRCCWASTSSPPACLRRRRVDPPPTRLAYYAAAVGRLRLHRRPASVAAEWCLRLHGWSIMPPLLGVYDFTAGLPPSPPSGASAYTAGLLCRRCWASTSSPPACLRRRRLVPPSTRLAYYAAAVGRLRLHRRPASVAAEWILRLHGWPIMPPLLGVYDFTAGLPPSPPSGASAYTAGLLCRRCWASTTSPPACLRRRRVVPPPTRLAYYAAAVGRLRLHRRPASVAADWCLRLHGWPIMPLLLGVYVFTAGLPPSPPTGASAYTAGLLCRCCWASTTSPPACLRRRRVVPPPTRLAYYAAAVGRLRLHRRLASVAAEWCLRLHGWPIMPLLLGVYVFTAGLPPSPPIGASVYTAGLYGWLVTPPFLGVYVFTTGLPPSPPTGASAYTAGLLCRCCWASTTSPPTGASAYMCFRLHGWPIMPPLLGVYVFTDRLAFAAADWCFRLHGWPIMPPLLGVYVFTDRLAFAAADWCFRLHGWPLCRRCWASTSSPTGLSSPLPTGVSACTAGLYAAVVGRLRLHRPAASTAADWCFRLHGWPIMPPLLGVYVFTDQPPRPPPIGVFRLHGWPIMPPLLGVYVFTDQPPRPPPIGVSACTAGLLCCRCWASTSSPTGLPSPPPTGVSACTAGLLCRRCWASTSSPTGLPSPPPTGVSACTAGLYAAVVGRLRLHRPAAASAADWCHRLHGWPVITPTDAIFFTAGYIAVTTNRHQYLQHKLPTFAMAADWFLHFHGCMILPVLIGLTIFIAGRLVCC